MYSSPAGSPSRSSTSAEGGACTASTAKSWCWPVTSRPVGAAAASRPTTSAVLAAFGTRNTSSSEMRYAIRSSTTPPESSQHSVYCACPGAMRPRSLVRHALTKSRAPGPRTVALPRWETSKTPTASRTAACSFRTPPPLAAYSIGISQPPKSASLAPRATWRSCSGECSSSDMWLNLVNTIAGMPSVSVVAPSTASSAATKADAVVVGLRSSAGGPALLPGAEAVDEALGGRLLAGLRALGAKGKADEVTKLATLGLADFPLVVAAGVGGDPDDEALRRAVGAAVRGLSAARRVHVAVDGPAGPLAEGVLLGAYSYTTYKSAASKPALRTVTVLGD